MHELVRVLKLYPDRQAAQRLKEGFKFGFRLGYVGPRKSYHCQNLASVKKNLQVARQKIQAEIEAGRVAGPFDNPPLPKMRCSPLGLVEKAQKGKFRLIHHLSFPEGDSVNDYISDSDAKVKYIKFDEAVELVASMGRGAQIAKADLKDAFRILPVNCADFDLLGFSLQGKYYYDMSLPMGMKTSCKLFEEFSTFVNWLINRLFTRHRCVHYLDDWLFFGPHHSPECAQVLQTFFTVCKLLGIPIAEDKTVLPCTELTFLGLEIDTARQQVRVPHDKLVACRLNLQAAHKKNELSLKQLQSLLGHLNFLTRGVLGGRAFLQRLVNLTRGIEDESRPIQMSADARADIDMWLHFLHKFNGTRMMLPQEWLSSDVIHLYTDSAKSAGFGAFFRGQWFNGTWHDVQVNPNNSIAYLEYVPVLLSILVWGKQLANSKIILHSDNQAVVRILNRQSSKCTHIMRLVRRLTLACLQHNICLLGAYIKGSSNTIADQLSRFEMNNFFQEVKTAHPQPTPYQQFLPLTTMQNSPGS